VPKKKVGKPKIKYTQEQRDYIADCAFHGCQTGTIATLTGIPDESLRRNFGELLVKKRAERKLYLRKSQDKEASKGNSALLIFLGKNELEQADRKEHDITGNITFVTQNYGSSRRKKNSTTG